jgi:hypothetical protein
VSNDNEKSKFLAFRCPTKLYEKMFNVIDNGDRDVTATLIHNLESAFVLLTLLNKITRKMTDKQKESIIGPVIENMDPEKVDDYVRFATIYQKENRK